MDNVTQQMIDFIEDICFEDLPKEVLHECKRLLLDSIGCAIGGLITEKGKISIKVARRLNGNPEASIIGMGGKLACPNAAFANGELINALDYDAIIVASHIPPFVLPAILAVAEKEKADGRKLLLAMVIGFEIAARISRSTTGLMEIISDNTNFAILEFPAVHGYSGTIFGAIAGVGKLLNLECDKMLHAFGIGGSVTPMKNMPKWYNTPPAALTKYTMAGWLSYAAVTSAYLAQMGYTGILNILDGEDGYWKFSGSKRWDAKKATEGLGKEWTFLDIDYKPYPCCRAMHGGLDCFSQILKENSLKPEEIEEVNLFMHPLTEKSIWKNYNIKTHVDAQFSVPYVFAAMAYRIPLNMWQDYQTMKDPRILKFMSKIKWNPHPFFTQEMLKDFHSRPVIVEVLTKNGIKIKKEAIYLKGSSFHKNYKLTDEELIKKFKENSGRFLSKRKIELTIKYIMDLENLNIVDEFMENLSIY